MNTGVLKYSVVMPVRNEAENIPPLIAEITAVMEAHRPYEIVYVDDGSDDGTPEVLKAEAGGCPELRIVRHDVCLGQSAAIATGVASARGAVIITLDGDGQNDPADIPGLLSVFRDAEDRDRLLVTGLRAKRRDSWLKRVSSRVANAVRATLLGDGTPDTGCGLKVFSRRAFLDMPRFNHMHRFLPALMQIKGGHVVSIPVNHRPRAHGSTNYGVFDRLGVGIIDLAGVMWLKRRGLPSPAAGDNAGDDKGPDA